MRLSAWTDVGRVRPENEDAWCIEELDSERRIALVAVADGMGGAAAGEVASSLALRTFVEAVRAGLPLWADPEFRRAGLGAAAAAANGALRSAQEERPDLQGMGTTLTAALICDSDCYVAHIGDSRAYLIHDGAVRQLTDDHSVVGELVRSGSLSEIEAMHHPQRHLLTHALGTGGPLKVDLTDVAWAPGDILLLCTDGLSSLLTLGDLLAAALEPAAFASLARRLTDLANARGGHDNITVVAAYHDVQP